MEHRRIAAFIIVTLTGLGALGCSLTPLQKLHAEKKDFIIEREWIKATFAEESLDFRRLNRMKPVVTEKFVVAGNAIDQLVTYDRLTGKLIWSRSFQGGVEGGAQAIDNRLFFGSSDGFFYSLNLGTGATEWTFPVRAEVLGEPLVQDNRVYFVSGNNILNALDASSGQVAWTYNRMDPSQISVRGASRPVIVGPLIYSGFSDGSFVALNKEKGTLVWEQKLNQNKRFRDVDSTPVIEGDSIYVSSFDGALYCLDKDKGNIRWKVDEGGYSPVTLNQNSLYYGSTSGKMMALDKASGKVLWSRPGIKGFATESVVYRGLLVYGESSGSLQVLDAATGNWVDQFDTGRGITSSPYLDTQTGQLYFMSANALLYRIRLGWNLRTKYWPWG
ncbi:MAG: PQQ-binding-like beta-propeller repeat protein [Bdellovibrionales bacterium]|nr:PQQ-binding-like beta-propeller repeat protein [Bdellovibrionales bacterium]